MKVSQSHGLVILASFGFSFILVFSTLLKQSGVSSLQQVLFRLILALPLLLLILKGKIIFRLQDTKYFLVIGFVFSAFILSALTAIAFGCPIAVTSALIYTQPFFTAIIAHISRKEKLTLTKFFIVLVGISGAVLASGMTLEQTKILVEKSGVLFAFASGFLYALYLYMKRLAKTAIYTPLQSLFNTFLFAVPCLIGIGAILRVFTQEPLLVGLSPPNTYQFTLLILFAICSTILPYGALNFVNPKEISPTTEGTILLLDPVLHNVWAIVFFQQYVTLLQYLGIFLILSSAALSVAYSSKNRD